MVQALQWHSLLSGSLGALASCLAKAALSPDSQASSVSRAICDSTWSQPHILVSIYNHSWTICDVMEYLLIRGSFLLLMVACNTLMLGSFLRGMDESGSVVGPALATASNFSVSALIGYGVWGERHAGLWWVGFSMVLSGVLMLTSVQIVSIPSDPTRSV